MTDRSGIAVSFRGVSRHFGQVKAVDDVSFDIMDGEFFAMLGPSGSGKTTCLRLIAGFEQPTTGIVSIHGRNMTGVPPYDRDVNTVFQDYALFPHMSVLDNVAYGPMIRKVPKAEREKAALDMLEMVKLSGFHSRRPSQLSGGQRQRVALARALVNRPSVLLLDEPLGALDLKLREQMQVELKSIQRKVGITFVYVTHDQGEALSMSDRVAVFNQGRIEQLESPAGLYENPASAFVAGFVGVANLFSGAAAKMIARSEQTCSIRPERVSLIPPTGKAPDGVMRADGYVSSILYLGANTRYDVTVADGVTLTAIVPNRDGRFAPGEGDAVVAWWEERHLMRFSGTGGSV